MKKSITLFSFFLLIFLGKSGAQTFSPIALTNFNFDAVAEANSALANTSGAIDGSNYVMHSVAYASLYSMTNGLPNSGLISAGTRTYQMEAYTGNNILYTPMGTVDSLILVTPAAYSGLSLLCFSTEGNGSMDVTVRFTDNTTEVFSGQSLVDWYGMGNTILSGFDRVNRSGTTPAGVIGNPKMFWLDFPIGCPNRSKNIKNIKFQNTGTNPRNCILAISGAAMPTFTVSSSPVTCPGGTNGSATVTASGGLPPYIYSWSTLPVQTTAIANNLAVGNYTVTSQDAGLCPVAATLAITQNTVVQPPLGIAASIYTLCAGSSVTLTASGAASYTWNTTATTTTINQTPISTTVYTVGGYTSFNCYRTGSLSIVVNPLPAITFTTPSGVCINNPSFILSATPFGGSYAGTGVTFNTFYPNLAGIGSKTISYTYTDANGCLATALNTIVVNPLPVLGFTLSPAPLCTNSSTLSLSGTPPGGVFAGTGVSGSTYSPSVAGAGQQSATYTYTDSNNCSAQVTSMVMINFAPIATFQTTKKLYCLPSPTIYLNALPSGGSFTGPGTSTAGVFSPSLAAAGNHTITYSYADINGCVGKATFGATVTAICTGIAETSLNTDVYTVYPNPNEGIFSIKGTSNTELTIVNDLGQIVSMARLEEDNDYVIQVNLPAGIYFITGQTGVGLIRQKLIVRR